MSSSSKRKAGEPPGDPSAANPRTFLPVNCIPADSTPVNLNTSASHTLDVPDTDTATIPPELNQLNPRKWKRGDVKKYLEANKEEYDLEDEDITRLYEERVSGRVLLLLTKNELITTYGLHPGTASIIELLINALTIHFSIKRPALPAASLLVSKRTVFDAFPEGFEPQGAEGGNQRPCKIPHLNKDNRAYLCWRWWQSVRDLRFGDTSIITFPVNILGSDDFGSVILVRDCYKYLYNKIIWNQFCNTGYFDHADSNTADSNTADSNIDDFVPVRTAITGSHIINGTPGIGKSFFGFYLICRYAHEFPHSNIEWENSSLRVIFLADGGIQYRLSGTSIISIEQHGEGDYINYFMDQAFYIADAIRPTAGDFRPFVLVTSPQAARYKELAKKPSVKMLGMPTWDYVELEELRKLRFSSVTQADLQKYFDKWGGVPRSVLERTDSIYQQDLEDICSTVDIDTCMRFIGTLRYNSTAVSGTVLHMSVTCEGFYADRRVRFASLYTENMVISNYEKGKKEDIIKYIRETEQNNELSSMRGFIFEAVAHRILRRGGVFEIRRLGHPIKEKLPLPATTLQIFRTIGEIKPAFYCRPHSKTFESIDALHIGHGDYDELFQMTVGKQHGIKVNGLENIKAKLTKKVRLYFVIPNDAYPNFINPQNYLNLQGQKHQKIPKWINDVEQWALRLDYTTF